MKRIVIFLTFILISFSISAQEIKNGTIISFGEEHDLEFIEIDGKIYISWLDLNKALPNWFNVNEEGKIVISYDLLMLLYSGITQAQQNTTPTVNGTVIESKIDGEFEGWEGDTIFKLMNGQIWQQDEYAYTYTYKYMPDVIIMNTSRGWIMQVEGMTKTIRVKRIK